MLRKGCNTKRSLSPVTMASAPDDTASDKNLSSFGSLLAVILVSSDKYFSNLGLQKTAKYSLPVSTDRSKVPVFLAFFNAMPGGESSFNKALNNVLVSNIQNLLIIFQQFIQLIWCKTFGSGLKSSFFHNIKKLLVWRGATQKIIQPCINIYFRFPFYSSIRFFKRPGDKRGNGDRYILHTCKYLIGYPNIRILNEEQMS